MAKRRKTKDKPPAIEPEPLEPEKDVAETDDEPSETDRRERARNRDDELCGETEIKEQVIELMKTVSKGFQTQWERGNDQLDMWDVYDQVLGGRQAYAGNSQIYLPIVRQAVEARVTRFVNQIFPRSQRNVDCITSDEKPSDIMALLEHYIRETKLRTQCVPALMRNGDVEGHYNLYVGWEKSSRHVVYRTKEQIEIEGETIEAPEGEDDDIEEVETFHMRPTVEVLADCDVLVLPKTANSVGHALSIGGSVTVLRRWSKERIEQAIDDDEIDKDVGKAMIEEISAGAKDDAGQPNATKKHVDAAGITSDGGGSKVWTVHETWTRLKVDGERRLCRIYFGGGDNELVASVKRGPYWNDKCPVLSAPLKKISNVFKGQSEVKPVADLQYAANDTVNEAMDSAAYALMPIVMTNPSKNPRVGSMVLNLAAIWETDPNDTKFAQFPPLWKDGLTIVSQLKTEIFQILSVSPAQIPQSTGGKTKRNQAEVALEQQVDLVSTADVCTNLEDEVLTPLLRWFVDLDYQFRDKPLTVKQYGQMGLRAQMQDIPPIQSNRRYEFRWWGVEAAKSQQMMQGQVSTLNVIKGIPPQQYEGYKLNAVPLISMMIENVFGPRLAPQIFEDIKSKLTVGAEQENEFLIEGLSLPVHELDDDEQHMKEHLKALVKGDPTGAVREHMLRHRMQMNQKMQIQQQSIASMQRGLPGSPGGGPPGAAGAPRPGAQPTAPRGGQNPAGAIHQDRMQDASAVPRR